MLLFYIDFIETNEKKVIFALYFK